jgi:hypothetical protein
MQGNMTMQQLSEKYLRILTNVVRRRDKESLRLIDLLGVVRLTTEQREQLRSVLCEELCEHGLREDDEPNEYGKQLDEIIGILRHY